MVKLNNFKNRNMVEFHFSGLNMSGDINITSNNEKKDFNFY
jgi:hypothetical protein